MIPTLEETPVQVAGAMTSAWESQERLLREGDTELRLENWVGIHQEDRLGQAGSQPFMGTESRTGENGEVAFNLELWCAGYFHINFLIYSPQQLRKGTIIIPIFQPKKLRVRACLARDRAKIWAQVLLILKSKLFLFFFFSFHRW